MNKHYYQNFDLQAEQIKYFQFCDFLLLHCAQKSPSTFSTQLIGFNETALCIFIGIMNTTMAQRYAFYHVWVRRSVVQSSVSYCSAEQCCDLRLNVRNPSVLGVDGNRDYGSHMNIFFHASVIPRDLGSACTMDAHTATSRRQSACFVCGMKIVSGREPSDD